MIDFEKEFDQVTDMLDIIGELVKDGTDQVINVGGKKVRIIKKDGQLNVQTQEVIDSDGKGICQQDSWLGAKTKEDVNISGKEACKKEAEEKRRACELSQRTKRRALDFKNKMSKIDDCTFMTISDELAKEMDLNKFSQFLDQEMFDADDAQFMDKILTYTSNVIKKNINSRINELQKLFNEF